MCLIMKKVLCPQIHDMLEGKNEFNFPHSCVHSLIQQIVIEHLLSYGRHSGALRA